MSPVIIYVDSLPGVKSNLVTVVLRVLGYDSRKILNSF